MKTLIMLGNFSVYMMLHRTSKALLRIHCPTLGFRMALWSIPFLVRTSRAVGFDPSAELKQVERIKQRMQERRAEYVRAKASQDVP